MWKRILCLGTLLVSLLGPACELPPAEPEEKIPVTTSSEQARRLFLEGRDLADKLRFTDARELMERAVAEDANFALAHLWLANTATTTQQFFDALEDAVRLADGASEAERLMILAAEAGAKARPEQQQEHLRELIGVAPQDERGHLLLGEFYFGRQEWESAVEHFRLATELAPDFSPPYNSLGYAHRFLEQYEQAEQAFRRYVDLIPDEPNPYDSYAELMMKTGRFEESIEQYRKALTHDPDFVASYVGIGNNQLFLGRYEEARETFRKLHDEIARNDAERRQALLWTAASHVFEADYEAAMKALKRRSAIAEATGDVAAVSADLVLMGDLLLEAGYPDQAGEKFAMALRVLEPVEVEDSIKQAARRNGLYHEARVALARNDLETARAKTAEHRESIQQTRIPFEVRRSHVLAGRIALHDRDYATAVAELQRGDQQDPRVLYQLAAACRLAGDDEMARRIGRKAARFNGLDVNFAYVRDKARRMLEEIPG